jgi:hypothetical protein
VDPDLRPDFSRSVAGAMGDGALVGSKFFAGSPRRIVDGSRLTAPWSSTGGRLVIGMVCSLPAHGFLSGPLGVGVEKAEPDGHWRLTGSLCCISF